MYIVGGDIGFVLGLGFGFSSVFLVYYFIFLKINFKDIRGRMFI